VRRTASFVLAPRLTETFLVETLLLAVVFAFALVVLAVWDFPLAETCAVPEDRRFVALDDVVACAPEPNIKPKKMSPITLTSFDTRRLLF
jgi:hypothetical protein